MIVKGYRVKQVKNLVFASAFVAFLNELYYNIKVVSKQ